MAELAADPGVTAPPAEPVADATAPSEPPVSEDVKPSGKTEEQTVPFARFQEVNDKAKAAEEEARIAKEELAQSKQTPPPASKEDDLDPEVVDLVNKSAKQLGYVTKEELDARETQIQVRQDVKDLESTPPVQGIPYDHKAVMEYATANNLPITSKSALQAAYKEMNWDKIVEAERNRAVESYKTSGSAGAEKPGSAGAQPPEESEVSGSSPRERTRSRIGAARQKLQV